MADEVTLIDVETGEEVGVVTASGELHSEEEPLQEIAQELTEQGGIEMLVPGGDEENLDYGDFIIEPGDKGFLRAVVDSLPSPYDAESDVLSELADYEPPADEYPGADEGEEDVAEKMAKAAAERLSKEWTGPHQGERGGTYWLNTETDERRYQEDKPAPEEGGSEGDEDAAGAGGPDAEAGAQGGAQAREIDDGVWAVVEDYDSFHADTWPDEGDEVILDNGEVVEAATGGGPFTGPDGVDYLKVEWQGNEMTIPDRRVEGVAEERYDAGEYDVDTEWGLKFADSINSGEFGEQGADGFMGVRDIQHHASDVDNPQVLADAIAGERDQRGSANAERAMKSRIRALGADPGELLPDTGGEGAHFGEQEYDDWMEKYGPEAVTSETLLADKTGVEPGISASNMWVQELKGEDKLAFKTRYRAGSNSDGMNPRYRDEITQIGAFGRNDDLDDSIVPVAHDEENGEWTAVKQFGNGTEAEEVSNMPRDWSEEIDAGDAVSKFARMMIPGAADLHSNNVMVSEEGELGFHDLDHAAYEHRSDESGQYGSVGSAARTTLTLFRDKEYEDLPESVQSEIPGDEWTPGNQQGWDLKTNMERVIGRKAQEEAYRMYEESDAQNPVEAADKFLREPDEGYRNEQEQINQTIRENFAQLVEDYKNRTGEQ